jgi:hypothetical protein
LGVAEQAHSHFHYVYAGPGRAQVDAALATVQAVLDPQLFTAAFTLGQLLSIDKAFATILAANRLSNSTIE